MQASRVETDGIYEHARFQDTSRDLSGANHHSCKDSLCGGFPERSTMRGKYAAIADVTVQAAANANDNRIITRSIGICGLTARPSTCRTVGTAFGRKNRLSGSPIKICAAAHA